MSDIDDSGQYELAVPKPESLIESLRSVGYSLPTAIADILDNSVAAGAKNIWLHFSWEGANSSIEILDDGWGMSSEQLFDAMRPGSQSPLSERSAVDLGRFGLGLKTASFSQCRKLTVVSKTTKSKPASWQWDLDYVRRHKEWRLRRNPAGSFALAKQFGLLASATLVCWQVMDRVVDERDASNDAAQAAFHAQINEVKGHLAMTFHRYLAGEARNGQGRLRIFVNGRTASHQVQPWNPFLADHAATMRSPVEVIDSGPHRVRVQGFVLPHKDRLSAKQYEVASGPKGWNAQQGFYVYRQDRVLVAGDWLRLGQARPMLKEEHHRLARLSIDITNDQDFAWSLDVKKSTARPPIQIRDRLFDLAGAIRTQARQVFFHRGEVGSGSGEPLSYPYQRPWVSSVKQGRAVYRINREHPLPVGVLRKVGPLKEDVESLLRLIEETVPVERIWLDAAENPGTSRVPYQGTEPKVLWSDIKRVFEMLRSSGWSADLAAQCVANMEPFNRYPEITAKLKEI